MRTPTIIALLSLVIFTIAPPLGAADLPSLRGIDSAGHSVAAPGGLKDPKQAKLLWKSEEPGLGVGWGITSRPSNKGRDMAWSSGYGGPVVANGQVYLVYYRPEGEVIDEQTMAKAKDKRPQSWAVTATDICVCRDAETGEVLWRAEFPGKGLNWNYERKSPWMHAVVADGRVFFQGTGGYLYAVDEKTGETLWEAAEGPGFEAFASLRRQMLAAKTTVIREMKRPFSLGNWDCVLNTSPCVVDGLLIYNDGVNDKNRGPNRAAGLTALDVATGKLRWRLPAVAHSYITPVFCEVDGRTLCFSATKQRLLAIDPQAGKVLHEIPIVFNHPSPFAVGEGHVVMQGTYRTKNLRIAKLPPGSSGPMAYRITKDGFEKAWALDVNAYIGCLNAPAIHDGHAYVHIKGRMICVELASGKVVAEVPITKGKGGLHVNVYFPLQISSGVLSVNGTLFTLDPKDFRVIGEVPVGCERFTWRYFSGGRIYARGRANKYNKKAPNEEVGTVTCYDLRK